MRWNHVLSSGAQSFAAKLAPKYSSPYTIVEVLSPVVYELDDSSSRKNPKVHVKDLKPYNPSVDHLDNPGTASPSTSPAPGPSKRFHEIARKERICDLRSNFLSVFLFSDGQNRRRIPRKGPDSRQRDAGRSRLPYRVSLGELPPDLSLSALLLPFPFFADVPLSRFLSSPFRDHGARALNAPPRPQSLPFHRHPYSHFLIPSHFLPPTTTLPQHLAGSRCSGRSP